MSDGTIGFICVMCVITILIICITVGCCYSYYNDKLKHLATLKADREESDAKYAYYKFIGLPLNKTLGQFMKEQENEGS